MIDITKAKFGDYVYVIRDNMPIRSIVVSPYRAKAPAITERLAIIFLEGIGTKMVMPSDVIYSTLDECQVAIKAIVEENALRAQLAEMPLDQVKAVLDSSASVGTAAALKVLSSPAPEPINE